MAFALAFVICPTELVAQCEIQKLAISDAEPADQLGRSVSISGNVAVIGHRYEECQDGPGACGATYVYRFDGLEWHEEQKLTASDAEPANFGWSVSNHGDLIVIGTPYDDCDSGSSCGAAYVYRFDGETWVEEQKLTASDGATDDQFGWSVSVNLDTVVVGARLKTCIDGPRCGAAYVYRFDGSTWT
ncbi:MAG: FG-GAP repeat protein, partial [Planctomycetes bacterium]|nr:FG-GAP repeat protein [Planctomycetota bacterium]